DKKETPPPAPQVEATPVETAPVESHEENDGTSINVGSDGIDIKTKDGKNQTKVKVEGGEANLEIKK
ncbi:MAG: hypothetical protein WBQ70_12935, partial [Flavobacterium sp.]